MSTQNGHVYSPGQRFTLHFDLPFKDGHFFPPLLGSRTTARSRVLRPLPHDLLQDVQPDQGLTTQSNLIESVMTLHRYREQTYG